ncbi:MAG: AAA-like domain-containing protein [Candidatus Poribacteria bacterium]|nr:AAA-like domain-containing protein [Candidatus Poribacteria bacterium]
MESRIDFHPGIRYNTDIDDLNANGAEKKMRYFETRGPVYPESNYVVARTEELADFIDRVKKGRYIVLFAPRQTGKTTFFQRALDTLAREPRAYFPIQLNFETYADLTPSAFYGYLRQDLRQKIEETFQSRGTAPTVALSQFLDSTEMTDSVSMRRFFEQLGRFLADQKVCLIIDEFDGVPQTVVSGFRHSLRYIYLSGKVRCPHSVGIVGVKSITQLNYDRSISPFNIQDEFKLLNFTREHVRELLAQYTDEVGQSFAPEVIEALHKQTAGQPFLVNRLAQILTEELDIPKTETIDDTHFVKAHTQLLEEDNVNIAHLLTNIRRDSRFETLLMKIVSYDRGVPFTLRNDIISELTTYGIIAKGEDGPCEIVNPIYQHCILQAFKPLLNGLEGDYFPEDIDTDFIDHLTPDGHLEMGALLDQFADFIARVGFRILQVPDTPQEFVGQYLLFTYLDQFVRIVRGTMYLEVQSGRGRIDLLILHNSRKYIVETKIWEGNSRYQAGKKQLSAYLKLEGAAEGYYVVFDHRMDPEHQVETEVLEGVRIRSYVIPVLQARPSTDAHITLQ